MRKLPIVTDTREQLPLDFTPFEDVRTVVRTCWPGDYTIEGSAARLFAVERKSVSDLIGTMCTGYAGFEATTPKRFDCELLALRGILSLGGVAFVLVEPDHGHHGTAKDEIDNWGYRADIPPEKVRAFINKIRFVWRIPVRLADSRHHAAEIVRAAAMMVNAIKPVALRIREMEAENDG